METNHKHCQTFTLSGRDRAKFTLELMYDETIVVNAQEIESPVSSEGEKVVKSAMAKFNPPVRHTARHDFDSESESESERDNFLNDISGEDQSPDRLQQQFKAAERPDGKPELAKQSSKERTNSGRTRPPPKHERDDSSNSDLSILSEETDSVELEPERANPLASGRSRAAAGAGGGGGGVVIPAEGAYDPKHYQDLKVPADMENLFQYIMKYTPQKIDIEFKLQPFIPEYVPAVGDIDAFIKVATPACNVRGQPLAEKVLEHIDNLGLSVLDEPAAEQSDSALLHLQLRALSKTSSAKTTVLTKKIENAEKNSKAIDRWIKDVSELHLSKPAPTVSYTSKMPDIDSLMEEWPENIEETLNEVGFPPPNIDCSLSQYVDLVCGLFDIPIGGDTLNDRIQALHLLFSLYSAVRSSQLYAERQKEKSDI